MSLVMELHQAHKERLRRFARAAYRPPVVVEPDFEPDPAPKPAPPAAAAKPLWFQIMPETPPGRLTVKLVIRTVAEFYSQPVSALSSDSRCAWFVRPRQVAMYLAREMLRKSFPEIGMGLGGRDHTTVLHAHRKIERLLKTDAELRDEVACIRATLLARAGKAAQP